MDMAVLVIPKPVTITTGYYWTGHQTCDKNDKCLKMRK